MKVTMNENGKRLIDIEDFSKESHREVKRWQSDTEADIHRVGNEVSGHHMLTKKWKYDSDQKYHGQLLADTLALVYPAPS